MDGLLRGQEKPELIEALFEKSFDLEGPCVLFPVRHHSPACSFHLKKVIEAYRPQVILIEGPENASELVEYMTAPGTKAPFCIYLSFDDKEGRVGGEPEKYRAYYPFLDYSPEYTAIREGARLKIPCRFIDLSYGEKLLNSVRSVDEEKAAEADSKSGGNSKSAGNSETEGTYDDDSSWGLGQFYEQLVQKTGCRGFNELWEMLFEIGGCHGDTRAFVRNLFYYCWYTRLYTDEAERQKNGDAAREQVMAEHVMAARKDWDRILVVTGGMHTVSLAWSLFASDQEASSKEASGKEVSSKGAPSNDASSQAVHSVVRLSKKDSPAYLMPYSYESSDQASGYQSGMVFPYFYQRVWENLEKDRRHPYEDAVMHFIISTAGSLRKKQAISIADEMQSFYMAKGLARMRDKEECGVFELLDAVQSSFVKGELNAYYQPALRELTRRLTGMTVGQVDEGAGAPPLALDFQACCRRFRIATNSTLKKEVRLDVYNKEEHRRKSQFFFQMKFLETGFCQCKGSQEDKGSTGRILLRETWEYRYTPQVQAALINASVYGATLREASLALLSQRIRKEHQTAASLAGLLTEAWKMGLTECFGGLFDVLSQVIGEDMDFLSVMKCFETLCALEDREEICEQMELDGLGESFSKVRKLCLNRGFTLLYTVLGAAKTEEDEICRRIAYLHQYFLEHHGEEEAQFLEEAAMVAGDPEANRALLGVCSGVLLKRERMSMEQVFDKFSSFVEGTEEARAGAVSFLKGFLMTAKDTVFVDDRLLKLLDTIIQRTHGEQFMSLLPDLRLAFTSFLPFETDRIAGQVAALYHVAPSAVLYERALDLQAMEEASEADRFCRAALGQWFGGNDGTD